MLFCDPKDMYSTERGGCASSHRMMLASPRESDGAGAARTGPIGHGWTPRLLRSMSRPEGSSSRTVLTRTASVWRQKAMARRKKAVQGSAPVAGSMYLGICVRWSTTPGKSCSGNSSATVRACGRCSHAEKNTALPNAPPGRNTAWGAPRARATSAVHPKKASETMQTGEREPRPVRNSSNAGRSDSEAWKKVMNW
jgi:hypothetical protein